MENPFVSNFDEILKILKKHDIVLSLGNTMRSGCIHDARDKAQVEEIKLNVELAKRAHEEGSTGYNRGHGRACAADRIAEYVKFHKQMSQFPLFVAGPLPTDVAVGYDHIAGSVGASIASGAGADYLCYITPSEHLGLPSPEQVREGLIAFKIAAHIGDSIKYGHDEQDRNLARKRANLDWEGQMEYALDSDRARELSPKEGPCTMCGDFCAIKIMKEFNMQLIAIKTPLIIPGDDFADVLFDRYEICRNNAARQRYFCPRRICGRNGRRSCREFRGGQALKKSDRTFKDISK